MLRRRDGSGAPPALIGEMGVFVGSVCRTGQPVAQDPHFKSHTPGTFITACPLHSCHPERSDALDRTQSNVLLFSAKLWSTRAAQNPHPRERCPGHTARMNEASEGA